MRDKITAADLGIVSEQRRLNITVAMPRGGFKNTRVITKNISLAKVAIRDDAEVTPRMLRARRHK